MFPPPTGAFYGLAEYTKKENINLGLLCSFYGGGGGGAWMQHNPLQDTCLQSGALPPPIEGHAV